MKKLLLLSVLLALPAAAEVRVPLQGHLTDNGSPVTGPVNLEVRIIDVDQVVRTCEVFGSVPLTNGVFNLMLGDTLNDCGGTEPTAITPDIFQLGPSTVRVTYNGSSFDYPIGDVPSAGHALTCDSASMIGGYTVDLLAPDPRVFRAPEGELANAIADATALGGPALIELGPGTHVGTFTIPSGVTLRGAGRNRSIISGALSLLGDTRAESLSVNGSGTAAIELRPLNSERVELIDVHVTSSGPNAVSAVLVSAGGSSSDVLVERSTLIAFGATAIGFHDKAGVRVEMRDSEIRVTNPAALGFGIRVGEPGANVGFHTLDVRQTKISVSLSNNFCAGIEVNSSGDGYITVSGSSIGAQCPNGQGISVVNTGTLDVRNAQVYADGPLYRGSSASFVVGGSKVDKTGGSGSMLAPGSSPVSCFFSYSSSTGRALDAACATTP